ncbi:GPI-ANCHORED PROTEIN LLG1-RELATED-RELATED [Salix purpurea]|uniref:GPI-ANCHORED PROTEIN LLG1-RELATED-RELATED n=1 Tax=Salix purpurea TaxID=77065 RepID=A0A9Q0WQU1_SALPP|nr:GPI-ANCHORED PROTEIN LLG1-RELATED-RELATED [Salix purpurea]
MGLGIKRISLLLGSSCLAATWFTVSIYLPAQKLWGDEIYCPVNFEIQNYTIITSQCKGPQYPPSSCCGSFKEFACPYVDVINDLTNDCASIMFSYINLNGNYPPGLFANLCRDGKLGLECPASPPSELAYDKNGSQIMHDPPLLLILLADHQLLLSHFKRATTPSKKQLHAKFVVSGLLGHHPLSDRRLLESYVTVLQIYYAVSILREYPDVS